MATPASYPVAQAPAGIWSIPQARNPHFTGRDRVLDALHTSLSAGRTPHARVQAIYGNGGAGKTQLALEYAYRYRKDYDLIWWLPCAEPAELELRYEALACRLDVIDEGGRDERCQAVCQALEQRTRWLLIFDNAVDADLVRNYLPERGGHVLITSRDARWHGVAHSFCLRVMERAESIQFLLARTGRMAEPAVATLAQALGDLPLALEQAAAVIREGDLTFAEYLRQFENHWAELLRSGRSAGDYPDTVAMTWELACRQVEEHADETAALLKVLSFLGASRIPLPLLQRAIAELPVPLSSSFTDAASIQRGVATLQRYALLSSDALLDDQGGSGVAIHRLVASLTRDRLPLDQQHNWCAVALGMMARSFGFDADATETWANCAIALPHALAAATHAEAMGIQPALNAKLLNEVGEYLYYAGLYGQARSALERALALCDLAHGSENPRRSAISNNLGRVMRRMGDLDQAKQHFEAAFNLDRVTYGESHPHVAEAVNNYGACLHQTGEVELAVQQFEWALEVCRLHYGDEHPKVATVINNLGYALGNLGDLDAAMDHFSRAVAMAEAACGPEHPVVLTIRTNLGIVLRLKGQGEVARWHFERAAALAEEKLGRDHPEVARNLAHLALLLQERGDLAGAKRSFERALAIDERVLGVKHLYLIARLNDLGRCLKAMGDVDAAAACYERSAEILRHSRGAA